MKFNVIVFASQKGGSGKTTLSGHIAVQAQLAGAGPVAVIDTDPQRSLAQWHNVRQDNGLISKVSDVENIEDDIAEVKALGPQTIIIDTPPAATSAIGQVIRHADLVCIPTRPSPHDLRAVGATVDIVETHDKPMVFILNGAIVRSRITAEAALALSQHGTVAPVIIHNRVVFAASMTDGRTVMEVDEDSRSIEEIETLWNYLAERLDKIAQRRAARSMPVEAMMASALAERALVESSSAASERADAALDEPAAPEAHSRVVPLFKIGERPRTLTITEFLQQRLETQTAELIASDGRSIDSDAPGASTTPRKSARSNG